MKKAILFVLTLVLVATTVTGGLMIGLKPAAETEQTPDPSMNKMPTAEPDSSKIYSKATIDNSFLSDSVVIRLTVKASIVRREYTAEDFGLTGVKSIRDDDLLLMTGEDKAWSYIESYWAAKRISEEEANKVVLANEQSEDPVIVINPENFRRCFIVQFENTTKEDILNIIKYLETLDFVYQAEVNSTEGSFDV